MAVTVVVIIGTDYATPECGFVQSEDLIAITLRLELTLHVDETYVATDVVKADLV
jgi:hypothetical protein